MSKAVNIALAILVFSPITSEGKHNFFFEKSIIIIAVWQKAKESKKGISYRHTKYILAFFLSHIGEFQKQTAILNQGSKCLYLKASFLSSDAVDIIIL